MAKVSSAILVYTIESHEKPIGQAAHFRRGGSDRRCSNGPQGTRMTPVRGRGESRCSTGSAPSAPGDTATDLRPEKGELGQVIRPRLPFRGREGGPRPRAQRQGNRERGSRRCAPKTRRAGQGSPDARHVDLRPFFPYAEIGGLVPIQREEIPDEVLGQLPGPCSRGEPTIPLLPQIPHLVKKEAEDVELVVAPLLQKLLEGVGIVAGVEKVGLRRRRIVGRARYLVAGLVKDVEGQTVRLLDALEVLLYSRAIARQSVSQTQSARYGADMAEVYPPFTW